MGFREGQVAQPEYCLLALPNRYTVSSNKTGVLYKLALAEV